MKRLKSIFVCLLVCLFMTSSFTSCLTTKTNVGTYTQQQGNEYTYAKGKQFWLFWGIVPMGRTNVATPSTGDCQVTTKFDFIDVLLSAVTGGIVTSYSIKVSAKR